jgi:hypothetical protein
MIRYFIASKMLDYAHRRVETSYRKSQKNFREVCRGWLTDEKLKGVIWVTKKIFWEAPNENLSWETRNLIEENDKGLLEKKDCPTKWILKILFTLNTQRNNKQTSHQIICTDIYTHNVAKPYDKFYFSKNIIFLCFHEHQNTKLNYFASILKRANFRLLHMVSIVIILWHAIYAHIECSSYYTWLE